MQTNKGIILSLILTGAVLAGCTDNGSKVKQEAEQSLAKQTEMTFYTFSGAADIDMAMPPASPDGNPATATLLSIMKKSKLEWSGATSKDPVRFETNVKASPAGSSAAMEIPVILKDNKLYLSLPLLNKKDEYFSIDLANGQKQGMSPDSLKNTAQAASQITKLIIGDLDPKWFKKGKDPVKLADGKNGTVLQVDITGKNKQAVTDKLQGKYPQIVDVLSQNGLVTAQQADKMKKDGAKTFEVKAPGSISFTKDDAGFIREEKIELDYTAAGSDGQPANQHIHYHQAFNDINQTPKFEKDVPLQVRPFEEVMKRLAPAPGAAPAASPTPTPAAKN